jgi:hypothetical protein
MKEKKSIELIHLLIRFSDNLASSEGTIKEHLKIIDKYGYVWFGKFGRKIGKLIQNQIYAQIKNEKESYLFLCKAKDKKYIYISKILDIKKSIESEEFNKVPLYYRHKVNMVSLWIKIENFWQYKRSLLRKIYGSYGLPISEIIDKTMTGHMLVKTRKNFSTKKLVRKLLNENQI